MMMLLDETKNLLTGNGNAAVGVEECGSSDQEGPEVSEFLLQL